MSDAPELSLLPGDYTLSPNLGFYLPTYNADDDLWGDQVNANMLTLDTLIPQIQTGYLPKTGGALTGSLAVGGVIPTAPAPSVPTLFSTAESSGEYMLNAYRSGANAWNYRAAGFAGRIALDPTSGNLTLTAAPTGAASAALAWPTNGLRIDPLGNAMLGGYTLPADSDRNSSFVAATMILPIPPVGSAAIAFNMYHTAAGWKYLAAGYAGYYAYNNGNGQHIWISYANGAAGALMGAFAQMTLDATGLLTVPGAINAGGNVLASRVNNCFLGAYSTTGAYGYSFLAGSGGDFVLYGGATSGALTDVIFSYQKSAGGNFYFQYVPTAATWFWLRGSDKLIYNALAAVGGLTAYVVVSDERVKDVSAPMPYGLPEILKLNPIRFHRIGTPDDQYELGFSAQEMQAVMPEAVRPVGFGQPDDPGLEAENPTLGVMETSVIPALVNAVRTLEGRLSAVEGKLP